MSRAGGEECTLLAASSLINAVASLKLQHSPAPRLLQQARAERDEAEAASCPKIATGGRVTIMDRHGMSLHK